YHSIQFDFDLQDGMITVEDESNKRIYFNVEGQNNLTVNPNPKKVKLENNDKGNYS
ncbi:12009_t:CDS:2, partial [Rhizophagus irregularis]